VAGPGPALGLPGTPLAKYLGVDFEIVSSQVFLERNWQTQFESKKISREDLDFAIRTYNNVVLYTDTMLRVIKGGPTR
jgi:hypothetical protein